jgi:hypothetical protein
MFGVGEVVPGQVREAAEQGAMPLLMQQQQQRQHIGPAQVCSITTT